MRSMMIVGAMPPAAHMVNSPPEVPPLQFVQNGTDQDRVGCAYGMTERNRPAVDINLVAVEFEFEVPGELLGHDRNHDVSSRNVEAGVCSRRGFKVNSRWACKTGVIDPTDIEIVAIANILVPRASRSGETSRASAMTAPLPAHRNFPSGSETTCANSPALRRFWRSICQMHLPHTPKSKKRPAAVRPPGGVAVLGRSLGKSGMSALLFDEFSPVQSIRITPWIWRLIQPIAGTNEVVGGGRIGGGIRDQRTPSNPPRPRFQGAHQPQLKRVAAMPFQHADPAEVSCIVSAGRWNHAGKGHGDGLVKGEPPIPLIELRNWSLIEESQPVEVGQSIDYFIVMPVGFTDPVHQPNLRNLAAERHWFILHRAAGGGASHLPSMILMPSHIAPTRPVTMTVITALKV
jgi:hypothetical protein